MRFLILATIILLAVLLFIKADSYRQLQDNCYEQTYNMDQSLFRECLQSKK
jgi:hypothetical protein